MALQGSSDGDVGRELGWRTATRWAVPQQRRDGDEAEVGGERADGDAEDDGARVQDEGELGNADAGVRAAMQLQPPPEFQVLVNKGRRKKLHEPSTTERVARSPILGVC